MTVTLAGSGVSHDHIRLTPQEALPLTRTRSTLTTLLALVGMLLLASSASAKDRNHDGLPDRWEKRHHLSLNTKQARKDQDKDGLRNKAEFRAGTNPRDADSDNDGTEDGDENAGTIISFANGVLKISVFGGDPMSGQVTDATEIECEDSHQAQAKASHDDPSDDPEGDDHGDDSSSDDHGDDESEDESGDDHSDDQDDDQFEEQSCGTDQLTAGMKVVEAELKLRNGVAVFEKLELHP
jgi:hypothetical protein